MKSRKLPLALWVITGALLAAPAAWAVEALSTAELASHCAKYHDPNASEDRTFCVRYIQGFIDGAVATDERVTNNVTREFEQDESFSERAARTRIGTRLSRYGASVYAEFCLGDPVPLAEVVERVVADLAEAAVAAEHTLARDVVYLTLRSQYPCTIAD
ncbi:MAG: hypothetical protein MUE63_04165 [Xanthomonadales bacterium]|jgi:hypothetical protein|nr:hypothetical protein [Xanthomonadales bacterium]